MQREDLKWGGKEKEVTCETSQNIQVSINPVTPLFSLCPFVLHATLSFFKYIHPHSHIIIVLCGGFFFSQYANGFYFRCQAVDAAFLEPGFCLPLGTRPPKGKRGSIRGWVGACVRACAERGRGYAGPNQGRIIVWICTR